MRLLHALETFSLNLCTLTVSCPNYLFIKNVIRKFRYQVFHRFRGLRYIFIIFLWFLLLHWNMLSKCQNVIRNVLQTVRRINIEILGVKGLNVNFWVLTSGKINQSPGKVLEILFLKKDNYEPCLKNVLCYLEVFVDFHLLYSTLYYLCIQGKLETFSITRDYNSYSNCDVSGIALEHQSVILGTIYTFNSGITVHHWCQFYIMVCTIMLTILPCTCIGHIWSIFICHNNSI